MLNTFSLQSAWLQTRRGFRRATKVDSPLVKLPLGCIRPLIYICPFLSFSSVSFHDLCRQMDHVLL